MNTLIFYGLVDKQVCKDVTAGTVHQGKGWSQAGIPKAQVLLSTAPQNTPTAGQGNMGPTKCFSLQNLLIITCKLLICCV